jgi:hypothetical protein
MTIAPSKEISGFYPKAAREEGLSAFPDDTFKVLWSRRAVPKRKRCVS